MSPRKLQIASQKFNCYSLRHAMFIVFSLLVYAIVIGMYTIHWQAVQQEKESSFDYTKAHLIRPFYSTCPTPARLRQTCNLPRIVKISARTEEESSSLSEGTWDSIQHDRVNTREMSKSFVAAECKTHTWANRLFGVYQMVFEDTLRNYPSEEGFIFIEDDVVLLDWPSFKQEVCLAIENKFQFYSFYRVPEQSESWECIYRWGTQAFYIDRELMKTVINADVSSKCRLGIDLYFSSLGPWYATRKTLVRHAGKRIGLEEQ